MRRKVLSFFGMIKMLLVKVQGSQVGAKTPALQYSSMSFWAGSLNFKGMGTYFAYSIGGSGTVSGA